MIIIEAIVLGIILLFCISSITLGWIKQVQKHEEKLKNIRGKNE